MEIDRIVEGDCLEELPKIDDNSIDAIITDPPAGISFMSKIWDSDKGGRDQWIAWMSQVSAECLRVIKPGGHALVWALPRTSHWTGMAWEEAGWEPRDKIAHVFGSGFPKSLDISKAIDRSIFTTKTSNPDFQIVRAWVRGKVKAAGLTYKQIDTALGNANSHKASHYLDNSQPQLPTPEDWKIIKNLLHLDESLDIDRPPKLLVETFEREIVGYRKCRAGLAFTSEGPTELAITKPLSKEAEQWAGWGSALKPSHEDWWLFRKPLACKTIAENVLEWGCGGLNIDGCRISIPPFDKESYDFNNNGLSRMKRPEGDKLGQFDGGWKIDKTQRENNLGRFPANLIWSHSPLCTDAACHPSCPSWEFAKAGESKSISSLRKKAGSHNGNEVWATIANPSVDVYGGHNDARTPARFFKSCQFSEEDILAFAYVAKASRSEREKGLDGMPEREKKTLNDYVSPSEGRTAPKNGSPAKNFHPTIKPVQLISYLARLICPPGGTILDPFGGSGTLAVAAINEGFHYILIEKEAEYIEIAKARAAYALKTKKPKQLGLSESFKSNDIHM